MNKSTCHYDELSDTLYLSFAPGESATGVELNDHILLRIDKRHWRAIGLTIFNYSILSQPTELGQRAFPLTALPDLPPDVREQVIKILQTPPVNEYLTLSVFTPSLADSIPVASVNKRLPAAAQ